MRRTRHLQSSIFRLFFVAIHQLYAPIMPFDGKLIVTSEGLTY